MADSFALRCGRLLAVANAALIITNEIDFKADKEPSEGHSKEHGEEPDKSN